jgi:hypothetical protein
MHKIAITKNILTEDIIIKLKKELSSLYFINKELNDLFLKTPFYYTLCCKNIKINYLPISSITLKYMQNYLNRLVIIASIFKIIKKIEYWIIPCNIKRVFPKNGEYCDQVHINGGYTYINSGRIYIYRYENFSKVGIHELLHNSVLQSSENLEDADITELMNAFQLDTNIVKTNFGSGNFQRLLPSEAVIEAWAIIMNICFISIEKGISLQELYENEINFALSLSHKLAKYQEKYIPLWKEKTNAYTYIRLKTCILCYWNIFYNIKYPYNPIDLKNFLLKYNMSSEFLKKIKNAQLPKNNTCKLTFYGNI